MSGYPLPNSLDQVLTTPRRNLIISYYTNTYLSVYSQLKEDSGQNVQFRNNERNQNEFTLFIILLVQESINGFYKNTNMKYRNTYVYNNEFYIHLIINTSYCFFEYNTLEIINVLTKTVMELTTKNNLFVCYIYLSFIVSWAIITFSPQIHTSLKEGKLHGYIKINEFNISII